MDLSHALFTSVDVDFLGCSCVEVLLLPPKLKTVRHYFLQESLARRLDLSNSSLEDIGERFLFESTVKELLLPASRWSWTRDLVCDESQSEQLPSRGRTVDDSLNKTFVADSAFTNLLSLIRPSQNFCRRFGLHKLLSPIRPSQTFCR